MRLRSAKDKEYGLVCACAVPKTKSMDWYALARYQRQRVWIGMRLRSAEDKEYGLVCACAAPKTKSMDWYALARR